MKTRSLERESGKPETRLAVLRHHAFPFLPLPVRYWAENNHEEFVQLRRIVELRRIAGFGTVPQFGRIQQFGRMGRILHGYIPPRAD